jgi:hypothetical protein
LFNITKRFAVLDTVVNVLDEREKLRPVGRSVKTIEEKLL